MAGMDLPLRAVREQIASAVDVIIQVSRMRDGSRKVTNITEVLGMEGDAVTLQDAYAFDYCGLDLDGHVLGEAKYTGVRPRFTDRFLELGIAFDQSMFMVDNSGERR
jgi:pilus assembly protein CpaF